MNFGTDQLHELESSPVPFWDILHAGIMNLEGTRDIARIKPEVEYNEDGIYSHIYHIHTNGHVPFVVEAKRYYLIPQSIEVVTHALIQQYPDEMPEPIVTKLLTGFAQKNRRIISPYVQFSAHDTEFPKSITAHIRKFLIHPIDLAPVMDSVKGMITVHYLLKQLWGEFIDTTLAQI